MRRPASRGLRSIGAVLCIVLAAGCADTVDGGAVRGPVVGLSQLLPTPEQVFSAVGSPLDPTGPPRVGGIEVLPDGIRDADDVTPLDCLGVATPLMRVVYEGATGKSGEPAGVRGVALQDFARYGRHATVSSVQTGVVRLGSDVEAAGVFDRFAAQWLACAGTQVRLHVTPQSEVQWTVTDVRRTGRILSATILNGDTGPGSAFPTEHAVGLAADCIVDVDVAVTDARPERRVATGRAVDLVRLIQDEIG